MAKRSQRVKNDPSSSGLAERDCEQQPCRSGLLETRGLGQIDLEPIAFALISASHLGARVAEMFLHMGFFDLRRGGEAGAQRKAPKGALAFALGQIDLGRLDGARNP